MTRARPSVSIITLTKDRPALLDAALTSIEKQTVRPLEVVIVIDDTPEYHDRTLSVLKRHRRSLHIIRRNIKHSITYGRTVGMRASHGDIIVYLDDDCEAEPGYLEKFTRHFQRNPGLAAVVGRITNAHPDNPYSATQYAYYDRGLRRFFPDLTRPAPLVWGRIVDCEVMAIRRHVIGALGFIERHRRYRNDDVDLGLRLMERKSAVLFDPTIIAQARPRTTLRALWSAAFWNGFSDAGTTRAYHIDLRAAPYPDSFLRWYPQAVTGSPFRGIRRIWYALLLLSFPAVSRTGELWYRLTQRDPKKGMQA